MFAVELSCSVSSEMNLVTSSLLPSLLLLALLAVPAYSKGHHPPPPPPPVNQTSQCSSRCRGPPGRDGRDGPPGPSSPISLQDYINIKKELEQELKEEILTELVQNLTAPKKDKSDDCKNIGKTSGNPASSCREIFLCDEEAPSAQYWIRVEEDKKIVIKSMYCNMEDTKCGIRGGWMRVAHIDMTNASATCPPPLRTITSPKRMCARSAVNGGCSSVTFSSCGVPYTRVCGRAVGYAYYSTDGFRSQANGINGAYVDGLSITHGQPRKHIWTYAAGISEDHDNDLSTCPCAVHPGPSPPSFVTEHFHCESGNTGYWERQWHTSDPLWDGKGCDAGSNCCSTSGLPWFCRTLPCETTDDIEVRWCADEATTNDDFATQLVEIYVLSDTSKTLAVKFL